MRRRSVIAACLIATICALSPVAAVRASELVEVALTPGAPEIGVLERMGADVLHSGDDGTARVLVDSAAERTRLSAAFGMRTLVRDVEAATRAARAGEGASSSSLPSGRSSYRVLADYGSAMEALVAAHPGLVRALTLGRRSVLGRELAGVEIASNVNDGGDGRPVFLLFGLHHAREWPSGEVAMEFAMDLARRYGRDARWTALLDRVRVIVVPVVNPDGFVVSRGTVPEGPSGAVPLHRKNCAATTPDEEARPCAEREGVDLNRNYGAGWGGRGASPDRTSDSYRGPAPFSEPESRAVHELSRRRQVTGAQSLHNVVGQVLRQPGFTEYGERAPDEARMKRLGDAMATAVGYESLLGHELYPVHGATEDWNYIAQGALGYTVELGPRGAAGSAPLFQGPFQTHVVDQYLGGETGGGTGLGMREALLLEAEAAGDARDHAVVAGSAPAGALLKVRREFTTDSVGVCPDAGCAAPGPILQRPDYVETTLTVGENGRIDWHIGPSTRPWQARAGAVEAWTLTCELPGRGVVATHPLVVGRGQQATVDPCDGSTPVRVHAQGTAPPPLPPVVRTDPPGPSPSVSFAVDRVRLTTLLRRGLYARVRCSASCTVTVQGLLRGRRAVARGSARLRAGETRRVRVRFVPGARTRLRRAAGRRLDVLAVVTGRTGAPVTVRRAMRLR